MIKVNVLVGDKKWKKYISKPESYLKKKINKLNKKNKIFKNKKIEFSLLLAGPNDIKKLNKKFRKKNKSTDVLSFPFYDKKDLKNKIKKEKEIYLGDIIINLVKVNNKKNIKLFRSQFDKLWIHGLVHLFGYDHKKEKDFKKMKKVENNYLRYIK